MAVQSIQTVGVPISTIERSRVNFRNLGTFTML